MQSVFAQQLDFLMSLTGTTNSALARELSFDASYISRIRTGKRGVPLHQPFIEPASYYLASRITDSYQARAAERAIGTTGQWPDETAAAGAIIAEWLRQGSTAPVSGFQQIIDRFAAPNSLLPPKSGKKRTASDSPLVQITAGSFSYLGNGGKREAVEAFLTTLVAQGEPATLLLYSDECMDWLIEDPPFTARWQQLLFELVEGGTHIRILHTLTRTTDEMIHAVREWLPLYLTGNVESLYCPRIRDGICRRTLFVAKDKLVITSNSIEIDTDGMVSTLSAEPTLVQAFEREFSNLEALCRPLVQVAPLDDSARMSKILADFPVSKMSIAHNISDEDPLGILREALPEGAIPTTFDEEQKEPPVRHCAHLPEHVMSLVSDDGFVLIGLDEPRRALAVTERLLTASFTEFLRR